MKISREETQMSQSGAAANEGLFLDEARLKVNEPRNTRNTRKQDPDSYTSGIIFFYLFPRISRIPRLQWFWYPQRPMKTDLIFKDESYKIIGACFEVYREKGCGFLEAVYQECMEIELRLQGVPFVP